METSVFLVHHGETDWDRKGRLLGHADVDLNENGVAQSKALADALAGVEIAEIVTSPLVRAVQTAEVLAHAAGLEITRDPRLIDLPWGTWTGKLHEDLSKDAAYARFLKSPMTEWLPGGERLTDVRDRTIASIRQSLADNAGSEAVVLVTHAAIIQLALGHYLGAPLASYDQLRAAPGSLTVLRFSSDRTPPRVLAANVMPGQSLTALLRA